MSTASPPSCAAASLWSRESRDCLLYTSILNSLMMLSNVFLMMTRSMASASRILEVIDEKVDITDEDARDIQVEHGSITFDHVWFKYKADAKEYVLSDVSFDIAAGETVGIIGQTGSAKSTLIQLIPRLYDVTKGEVRRCV